MTADLTFYWERDPSSRRAAWLLFDKPRGESRWAVGSCSARADWDADASGRKKFWQASIYGGAGRCFPTVRTTAGSSSAAMRALERECDRRSIGLWGVDSVAFVRITA